MTAQSKSEVCGWHVATLQPIRLHCDNRRFEGFPVPSPPPPLDTWIAPPLFDLQVNGFAGVDFQQDGLTTDELLTAARGLRDAACSRFLLTLVTDLWPRMLER